MVACVGKMPKKLFPLTSFRKLKFSGIVNSFTQI